ncbi:MAG: GAF domain-containing protein [Cryomorphaceae bacterium]
MLSQNEESERLKELYRYQILDTEPEKGLNNLVEIASATFETPIALISLVDEDRQWFKANKGLGVDSTPRNQSFCQHTLHLKNDLLVVEDPENDERFRDNPLVTSDPKIRYYAGAPLLTKRGHVIGTLCIIDQKKRQIPAKKLEILKILAEKVINYIEQRKQLTDQSKQIKLDQWRLRFLADALPGAIFQLDQRNDTEECTFRFMSKGITDLHPALKPHLIQDDASLILNVIHEEDRKSKLNSLEEALAHKSSWESEFRIVKNDEITWLRVKATPYIASEEITSWYGIIENVHLMKEYVETLEKIAFDISHVLRGPVTNLMGLVELFKDEKATKEELRIFSKLVVDVSSELEKYTHTLNDRYEAQQRELTTRLEGKPSDERLKAG